MAKRGRRSPEGPNHGYEDKRKWQPCAALNSDRPCHSHREHKRAGFPRKWYGRVG